jgi:hypothetical protein
MEQRDIGRLAFQKTEESHRDIIWYTIFENPCLTLTTEFQVKKVVTLI